MVTILQDIAHQIAKSRLKPMSIDDDGRERKRSNSLRSDNMLHTSMHNFVIEKWCIIYTISRKDRTLILRYIYKISFKKNLNSDILNISEVKFF